MLKAEFEDLYEALDRNHLAPLWTDEAAILPARPQSKAIPWLWKWSELSRWRADRGARDAGAGRRSSDYGAGQSGSGRPSVRHTHAVVRRQLLNGREVAPAHRHSAQAVRFIIDGRGAYSTVQEEIGLLAALDAQRWLEESIREAKDVGISRS